MSLFVNQGLKDIARHMLGIDLIMSLQVCLWVNEQVPDTTDTMAQYHLCTLPPYAPVFLNPNQWQPNNSNGKAEYVYPQITFAFNRYAGDDVVVYGYLVQNIVTMHLIWVEPFVIPYTVPHSGGTLPVNISLDLTNCLDTDDT